MKKQDAIKSAIRRNKKAALVTIESVEGSAPRGTDAWLVVTSEGFHGTIGGGALEWRAIADAQKLLQSETGEIQTSFLLGPDLGQCCGGRVRLRTSIVAKSNIDTCDQAEKQLRCLYLFGAGHVGRALILALAPHSFAVTWCDPRADAFPPVTPQNVTAIQLGDPLEALVSAPQDSLTFVMTHNHELDYSIVDAALRNRHILHVGLIGSETKRARFVNRLHKAGVTEAQLQKLICPIGISGIKSKQPTAIAASTVAQILILDEALEQGNSVERPTKKSIRLSA